MEDLLSGSQALVWLVEQWLPTLRKVKNPGVVPYTKLDVSVGLQYVLES